MIWDTSIWKLGCSNRSKIRSAQKCYLCLRYVVSPMCPGRTVWQSHTYIACVQSGQEKALPSLIYHEPALEVRFARGAATRRVFGHSGFLGNLARPSCAT